MQRVDHDGMSMRGPGPVAVPLRQVGMIGGKVRVIVGKQSLVIGRPDAQHRNQPQRTDTGKDQGRNTKACACTDPAC